MTRAAWDVTAGLDWNAIYCRKSDLLPSPEEGNTLPNVLFFQNGLSHEAWREGNGHLQSCTVLMVGPVSGLLPGVPEEGIRDWGV